MKQSPCPTFHISVVIRNVIQVTTLTDWEDSSITLPVNEPVVKRASQDELDFIMSRLGRLCFLVDEASEGRLTIGYTLRIEDTPLTRIYRRIGQWYPDIWVDRSSFEVFGLRDDPETYDAVIVWCCIPAGACWNGTITPNGKLRGFIIMTSHYENGRCVAPTKWGKDMLIPLRHEWLGLVSRRMLARLRCRWDDIPSCHDDPAKVCRLTGNPDYQISPLPERYLTEWIRYHEDALRYTHGIEMWENCPFRETS